MCECLQHNITTDTETRHSHNTIHHIINNLLEREQPECRDKDCDTFLREAYRKGHVGIVRYLVSEQGCSTACQNENGNTPLLEVCSDGCLAIVEILLTAQNCSTASKERSRILLHFPATMAG